ncbi:MAG: hypothetical protein JWP87_1767 [Labilithrix sp.]|nr:hypothetical protein [Labilithrix sp.]
MQKPVWHGSRMSQRLVKSVLCAVVLGVLGIAVFACSAGTSSTGSTEPQKQAQVTSPTSGLQITATISAVTLGDECGGGAAGGFAPSADCAPQAGTRPAADGGASSSPAPGGCGGAFCQQSNMQIAFTATAGTQSAKVEVVDVTLLDAATGKIVDTLKATKPQVWSGNAYSAWDQTIKPAGELKASYDLSAPAWSTLSGSDTRLAYSTRYKLHVTLRIDGVQIVLESTDLSREPQVAT